MAKTKRLVDDENQTRGKPELFGYLAIYGRDIATIPISVLFGGSEAAPSGRVFLVKLKARAKRGAVLRYGEI